MMTLTAQTIELIQFGVYSATLVFLGMLLLTNVANLVIGYFWGD